MANPEEQSPAVSRRHHLSASPSTVHWGYLDAKLKPALTIRSGDYVTIDTVNGNPDQLPPRELGFSILADHLEVHRSVVKGTGNHIFTGPIAIEDAEPGDVLEVRILQITLRQDWAWNIFRPFAGTLPEMFPHPRLIHIAIDREKMEARMPWGMTIPIRPFFGQLAVAPRPEAGRQNSKEPREFGGNIDNKELGAGSTIYIPVWAPGALFSTGDGHAAQGDGEVCGTAVETALTGLFQFVLRKDLKLRVARAETPTHFITMGLDPDLDDAARQALSEMLEWIVEIMEISREQAYSLCSFVVDLRVTQTVNNVKGVHAMLDKNLVAKR